MRPRNKPANWTHEARYSRHRLLLELRALPSLTSPAYSNRTAEEADRIHLAMNRLSAELCRVKSAARSEYWMVVNLRWQANRARLRRHVVIAASIRKLERMKSQRSAQRVAA